MNRLISNNVNLNYQPTLFVPLRSVRRLVIKTNVFPSLLILVTLTMDALSSSETSDLTRATRRNILKDEIPRTNNESGPC
jgi:hypothetical protein